MHHARARARVIRGLVAAVITVTASGLAVAVGIGTASAATCPTKCYSAVLGPAQYTAGSTLVFRATLTNETTPGGQLVGSVDITPPSGYTVTHVDQPARGRAAVVGNVITLRELGLAGGQSATYTWTAQTPTAPGAASWGLQAKQSNDFRGTGNDVTLDPATSSTTTTGGSRSTADCTSGSVSCGTNFIDYSRPSSVSTGTSVNEAVWLVGTTSFPATTSTGGQAYSMAAPGTPDDLCLLRACTFQMNIDDIPATYAGRPATLTLLCHVSHCTSGYVPLLFKDDGTTVSPLPPCAVALGATCFTTARDAAGNLAITVSNLGPGDPKIAG